MSKGYDCEFVDPPPNALQTDCPICLLILREPYLTSCCGYNFCQACITRVQKDGKPCPLCNGAQFTTFHNKGLERNMKELDVNCEHKLSGCSWRGKLVGLDGHLTDECPHLEMKCRYANCHSVAKRKDISLHEAVCGFRPFHCDWCHDYASWYDDVINNHWLLCPKYPVPCEQCEGIVERQNIAHHVKDDCPFTVVDCEFSSEGCKVRLPRKDVQSHLNNELLVHLTMINRKLANENVILSKRLDQMAAEKTMLEARVAAEIVELKTKMAAEIEEFKAKMAEEIVQIKADQKRELNKQLKLAWVSIGKQKMHSVSSANSGIQIFSYATHVPPEAKEVMIYVAGYTGSNPISATVEITLETSEDGVRYIKYFYLYIYPQNAVSHNSENMSFPVTKDRCIHVKFPERNLPTSNNYLGLFVIGYRL